MNYQKKHFITFMELLTFVASLQIVTIFSSSIKFSNFLFLIFTAFILLIFSKIIRPLYILTMALSAAVSPFLLIIGVICYPFINILGIMFSKMILGNNMIISGSIYFEAIFISVLIIILKVFTKQYTSDKPKDVEQKIDHDDIYYDYKEDENR